MQILKVTKHRKKKATYIYFSMVILDSVIRVNKVLSSNTSGRV